MKAIGHERAGGTETLVAFQTAEPQPGPHDLLVEVNGISGDDTGMMEELLAPGEGSVRLLVQSGYPRSSPASSSWPGPLEDRASPAPAHPASGSSPAIEDQGEGLVSRKAARQRRRPSKEPIPPALGEEGLAKLGLAED